MYEVRIKCDIYESIRSTGGITNKGISRNGGYNGFCDVLWGFGCVMGVVVVGGGRGAVSIMELY